MTDEQKLEFAEKIVKSGAKIGNFVMDNHGTMTLSATVADDLKEKEDISDKTLEQGKDAIMEYVGRLKPVVKKEFQDQYDLIWDGILELSQVKAMIYKKGKQQDTSFNRNLLAKIIHQVDYLYIPSTNTVQMASYLEPEKGIDHPVRQKLGEVPEKSIKNAVDEYMKDKL